MSISRPSRPRRNFACRFRALTTSGAWSPPSGSMKQTAWRRSGLIRTSVSVTDVPASASSSKSSSRRISTRAWRMSSPARSWRWVGPTGPRPLDVVRFIGLAPLATLARGSDAAAQEKGALLGVSKGEVHPEAQAAPVRSRKKAITRASAALAGPSSAKLIVSTECGCFKPPGRASFGSISIASNRSPNSAR